MERSMPLPELLEALMCPAFTVKDGIIIGVNTAAVQRQIQTDTPIQDLIAVGADEYAQFNSGTLSLVLNICGTPCTASVTVADGCHIFCLISQYEHPELRAFAQASLQLREPLTNALASTQQLLLNETLQQSEETRQQLAQVNRGLYQLLRAVGNMSDVAHYAKRNATHMQIQDAAWVFDELLQKAANLASQAGRILDYRIPNQSVFCPLDKDKLERAVLNLISNALNYSPDDSVVTAVLKAEKNKLIFTVENVCENMDPQTQSRFFTRFLREPGIENGRRGIGLGMSIVSSIASMHSGTVLMEHLENRIRVTMTLSTQKSKDAILSSPILLPVDYAGGYDRGLVELSDVLPPSLFDETV